MFKSIFGKGINDVVKNVTKIAANTSQGISSKVCSTFVKASEVAYDTGNVSNIIAQRLKDKAIEVIAEMEHQSEQNRLNNRIICKFVPYAEKEGWIGDEIQPSTELYETGGEILRKKSKQHCPEYRKICAIKAADYKGLPGNPFYSTKYISVRVRSHDTRVVLRSSSRTNESEPIGRKVPFLLRDRKQRLRFNSKPAQPHKRDIRSCMDGMFSYHDFTEMLLDLAVVESIRYNEQAAECASLGIYVEPFDDFFFSYSCMGFSMGPIKSDALPP